MEEQFNKEAKQGWGCAADANASSEDRKHTSGGVFVAVDSKLGAVICWAKKKERSCRSQAMRNNLMCEAVCESFPKTSGTRKAEEMKR